MFCDVYQLIVELVESVIGLIDTRVYQSITFYFGNNSVTCFYVVLVFFFC